jgi:hypothetical protein
VSNYKNILEDIPENIKIFLTILSTPLKWEILNFFYHNPNTIGTAYDIAKYIGRNPEDVNREIEELVRDKILIDCGEIWGKVPWAEYTEFYKLNEEIKENFTQIIKLSKKHGKRFERIIFNHLNFSKTSKEEFSERILKEVSK